MNFSIEYPEKWTPVIYTCACGTKIRTDVEFITGPFSAQPHQHRCGKDEMHYAAGPVIAIWEWRDGDWVGHWRPAMLQ